jgi:hypothetical protein
MSDSYSLHCEPKSWSPHGTARRIAGSITVLLFMGGLGCNRQPDDPAHPDAAIPAAVSSESTPTENTTPLGTETADESASSEADLSAILAELTQAVRRYGMEQQQVPASLDDLVARGYLSQVPEAPRGQRFRINKQLQVYLAME